MTWLRLDDAFTQHPKVLPLTDKAFRLHSVALCYSARNLTDGVLSGSVLTMLLAEANRATRKHVAELVEAGLWRENQSGFVVRDFLDYNPSRQEVVEHRKRNAQRQAKYRDTHNTRNKLRNRGSDTAPAQPVPDKDFAENNQGPDDGGFALEYATTRLLSVLKDADEATPDVVRRMVRDGGLAVGDVEWARECAAGPGVRSPVRVAVAELRKRSTGTEAA